MAIIDLKTNLKKFKQTSSQPYITHEIPEGNEQGNSYEGIIGRINAQKDDVIRITKFMADVKNSAKFIATNVGLQKMNPLTELGENLRTYVLSTTLAQIGIGIPGATHRHGFNPFDTDTYSKFKQDELRHNDPEQNRLVKLSKNLFIDGDDAIQSYNGGANSIFGIGRTEILRTTYTDSDGSMAKTLTKEYAKNSQDYQKEQFEKDTLLQITKDVIHNDKDTFIGSNGTEFTRYDDYKENSVTRNVTDNTLSLVDRLNIDTTVTKDFRALLPNLINPVTGKPFVEAYENFNLERRVGLGKSDSTIGQLPIYYSDSALGGSPQTKIFDKRIDDTNLINPSSEYLEDQTRDLIRFRIELVDTDNPNFGQFIVLRSIISGYSVSYSSDWSSDKYAGRGEMFKTYSSTDSTISFNFNVFAKSKPEMRIMYQKINSLINGALYPSYKNNKMRGSMVRITVGDMLENQPAIITSFNLSIPDDVSWEIAVDTQNGASNGISKDDYVLPFMLTGSLTISPIYNFLPQKSLSNSFFILPNENLKKTKNNLHWINGDLRISKNLNATNQKYDSKYKDKIRKEKIVQNDVNVKSLNKSLEYQQFNA
jgi:hypothetical protein